MIQAIALTDFDDRLVPSNGTEFSEAGSFLARAYAGKHDVCEGRFIVRKTSRTSYVMLCEACWLRLTIPQRIKTYGELADFFAAKRRP